MGATTEPETECHQVQRALIRSILLVFSVTLATVVNVRLLISNISDIVVTRMYSLQDANASAFAMALPTIQKEMQLQQTAPQLQWIVSGYPLSCVSFLFFLIGCLFK